jgi:hypothetical protein
MRIRLSQLRRLIREAVEEAMEEDQMEQSMDELDELEESDEMNQWTSSYSSGGSGGNRHGDSLGEPERSDRNLQADREWEEKMDKQRDEYLKNREEPETRGWD